MLAMRDCSQQSRDVLDTNHKDERSHILGFVGDSPAHIKDGPIYGTGCVLQPPPPPRSYLAVTRSLADGRVHTSLDDYQPSQQLSPACCWTPSIERRSPSSAAVDEGYSSRPPSYVVCAGGGGPSSAACRRGDITSSCSTPGNGQTLYAVRRAAGECSCCHSQLHHRRHHHHHHCLYPQQQQQLTLQSGKDDNDGPDIDADQLSEETEHPEEAAVCQSSAGDDAATSRKPTATTGQTQHQEQRTNTGTSLHVAATYAQSLAV